MASTKSPQLAQKLTESARMGYYFAETASLCSKQYNGLWMNTKQLELESKNPEFPAFFLEEPTQKNQCEKTRFFAALLILPDILLLFGFSRIIVESL